MNNFENQVIVVSGGAQGIGAASAKMIAGRGGQVIILDRNEAAAENIATEITKSGGLAESMKLDVSVESEIRNTIDQILTKYKKIDALVNAAGIPGPTGVTAENVTTEDFRKTLDINLYGPIWLTQAVLPAMKLAKYGRIIHLSSIAGKEGNPGMAPYNVSKAGLIGFVKGVAKEAASSGITINALAPAVIRTPMNDDVTDETLKYMVSRIPVGRVGEVDEVAEIVAFAASRACSFTTGFTFDASGGRATY